MNGPETRQSLLLRLGDASQQAAWQEFVEIYEPLIYRLARKLGLQHADAADVTQDVFTIVEKAIGGFDLDPGKGSFRGWLFRIARNATLNFMTRQKEPRGSGDTKFQQFLEQTPAEQSEVATRFDLEYQRQVFRWASERVKQRFNAETWRAFWLTGVEQESIEDVARLLGKTPGAVRIARCRVLTRLRQEVKAFQESTTD